MLETPTEVKIWVHIKEIIITEWFGTVKNYSLRGTQRPGPTESSIHTGKV